ncbi:Nuclear migration protein [Yarrowia sp. B02]|nr:Nuclear migration protein [Yarrowia sp. B02]
MVDDPLSLVDSYLNEGSRKLRTFYSDGQSLSATVESLQQIKAELQENGNKVTPQLEERMSQYGKLVEETGQAQVVASHVSKTKSVKNEHMQFAAGLGEHLLVECRKLQGKLNEREEAINAQSEELDRAKTQQKAMEAKLAKLSQSEDRFKEENWNLELKVTELKSQLSNTTERVKKQAVESGRVADARATDTDTIEELQYREQELKSELEQSKARFESERSDWERVSEELHEDLQQYQRRVAELEEAGKTRGRESLPAVPMTPNPDDELSSDSDRSASASPSRGMTRSTSRNAALEAETLRVSFTHLMKQLQTAKNNIFKEKHVSAGLKRDLAEALRSAEKVEKSVNKRPAFGAGRRPTSRVLEEDEWEDLDGLSSEYVSALDTAQSTEDDYMTGVETLDGDSGAEDTETEDVVQDLNPRMLSMESELAEESDSSFDGDATFLRKTRSAASVGTVTAKRTPSASLAQEFMSEEDVEKYAEMYGLVVVPQEEYDGLVERAEPGESTVTEDSLAASAATFGLAVIAADKLAALQAAPTLESLQEQGKQVLCTVLPTEEYAHLTECVNAPGIDYIREKVPSSHVLLTKDEHDALLIPSIETIEKKLPDSHVLLTKAVHSELANPTEEHVHKQFPGHVLVTKEAHESLLNPTEEHVQSKFPEHVLLTKEAHSALQNPSVDSVADKFPEHVLLSKSEHDSLLNPTEEHVQQKFPNHVLLSKTDHDTLTKPSVEDVQTKFPDHVILTREDHSALVQPSLKSVVDKFPDHVILTKQVHDGLINPSYEFVSEKFPDHVLLSKEAHSALENPSVASLAKKLPEHVILTKEDHDALVTPSLDTIKSHVGNYNYHAIPAADYESLVASAEAPSLDSLKGKVQAHGHVVVDEKEYSQLCKPSVDALKSHATSHDHVIVPQAEYAILTQSAESPTLDLIKEQIGKHDHVVLHQEEFAQLSSPTLALLKEKIGSHGHVAVDEAEHQKLLQPSVDDIKTHAQGHGHVIVPETEYAKLTQPEVDDLKTHAAGHGHVIVPEDDYAKLTKPSVDDIKSRAAEHDHVVVPKEAFSKLTSTATAPSLEHIKDKVGSHGHAVIPETELAALKAPTLEQLSQHAETHASKVVSEAELAELHRKSAKPTSEELQSKAKTLGLVAVPFTELEALKRAAEPPSVEQLSDYAKEHGSVVVPKAEFDALSATVSSPSADFLKKAAAASGLALVAQDEYDSLLETVGEPSRDFISQHAKAHDLVVLDAKAHSELVRKSQKPSEDELHSHAKTLGFSAIGAAALASLTALANNPGKDHVSSKARDLGLVAIDRDEHAELVRQTTKPTAAEIAALAAGAGLVTVDKQAHKNLADPEHVTELASGLGLAAVPFAEHKELIRKSSKPSEDEVAAFARAKGLEVVSKQDKTLLEDPARFAAAKGGVFVSEEQHAKLVKPSVGDVAKHAEALGHVVVPSAEHAKLVKPSVDALETHAKTHGHVVLPVEQHKALLAAEAESQRDLTADELHSHAKKLNMVAISPVEHELLTAPPLDSVKQHATRLGHVTVPADEYHSMSAEANRPINREFVESVAPGLGLGVLSSSELEELRQPDLSAVSARAKALDAVVVPQNDYDALQHPSLAVLRAEADSQGFSVVETAEYDALKTPSEQQLLTQAARLGLIAMPEKDYDALKSPSRDALSALAAKQGDVLVPEKEHAELLARPVKYTPSLDELHTHSKAANMVLLSSDEHEALARPVEKDVRRHAVSHGLGVLALADLAALNSKANSPSKEHVVEHAQKHGLVATDQKDYNVLVRKASEPSRDEVVDAASHLGLAVLASGELEELERKVSQPSVAELTSSAAALDLAVVPSAELDSLKQSAEEPSRDTLEKTAKGLGLVLVEKKAHKDLVRKGAEPTLAELKEHAAGQEHVLVPSSEHAKLSADPSVEDVESRARKLGLVAVAQKDFDELKRQAEFPSEEELQTRAKALGAALVQEDVLAELHKDKYDVYAKAHHMTLVADDELAQLKDAHYETYAKAKGLVLVPERDLQELKDNHHETYVSNKGLVMLPSDELAQLKDNHHESYTKSKGLVMVPSKELSSLRSFDNVPFATLEQQAQTHGHVMVPAKTLDDLKANSVEEYTKANGLSLVKADELAELQTRAENPSRELLQQHVDNAGLIALSPDEHQKLLAPSVEDVTQHAVRHGHHVVSADELASLKASKINKDTVATFAAASGLSLVAVNELEQLRRKVYHPTVAEVQTSAKSVGLVPLTKDEYNQILSEQDVLSDSSEVGNASVSSVSSKRLSSVLEKRNHFEDLIKEEKSQKQREKIMDSVKTLGFVPVSSEEYKRLVDNQKEYAPTKGDVFKSAKEFGLVAIPQDEYKGILKKAAPLTKERVLADAASLGLVVSDEPVKKDAKRGSRSSVSLESVPHVATKEELAAQAAEFGLEAVPVTYLTQLKRIAEAPEPEDVREMASRVGLVVVSAEDVKRASSVQKELSAAQSELSAAHSELSESQALAQSHEKSLAMARSPDLQQVAVLAAAHGCVTVNKQEFEQMSAFVTAKQAEEEKHSLESLGKLAAGLGLAVVPFAHKDRVKEVPVEKEVVREVPVEKEVIKEVVKEVPVEVVREVEVIKEVPVEVIKEVQVPVEVIKEVQVPVEVIKEVEVVKEVPVEVVKEVEVTRELPATFQEVNSPVDFHTQAKQLGFTPVPHAEYHSLANPSDEEIRERAKARGFVAVPFGQYSELQIKAHRQSVHDEPSEGVHEPARDSSVPLSAAEIEAKAQTLGLVTLSVDQYKELERLAAHRPEPVVVSPELTKQDVETHAKTHGLVTLPSATYTKLVAGQNPSANQVRELAARYGLVVLSSNEMARLQQSTPTQAPVSQSYQSVASHTSPRQVPESSSTRSSLYSSLPVAAAKEAIEMHSPRGSMSRDSSVASQMSRYSDAQTHQAQTAHVVVPQAQPGLMGPPAITSSFTRQSVPASTSFRRAHYESPQSNVPQTPQRGMTESPSSLLMSNATIASNASFNDKNMIAVVTQTMIGEYLYKYTRRFGSVSGISENRHQRYFWVHPYTLTLYWSVENPSADVKAGKVKSVPIVSVVSEEDDNPLPPGLFHKSLLIGTPDRVIKVTCPTRQRHNIWYSSLRYLLTRSPDFLLDDGEANSASGDELTADARLDMERHKTVTAAYPRRDSSLRAIPQVKTLRRSSFRRA